MSNARQGVNLTSDVAMEDKYNLYVADPNKLPDFFGMDDKEQLASLFIVDVLNQRSQTKDTLKGLEEAVVMLSRGLDANDSPYGKMFSVPTGKGFFRPRSKSQEMIKNKRAEYVKEIELLKKQQAQTEKHRQERIKEVKTQSTALKRLNDGLEDDQSFGSTGMMYDIFDVDTSAVIPKFLTIEEKFDRYVGNSETLPKSFTKEEKMELTHEFLRRVNENVSRESNRLVALRAGVALLTRAMTSSDPIGKIFYVGTTGLTHSESRATIKQLRNQFNQEIFTLEGLLREKNLESASETDGTEMNNMSNIRK